MRPADTSSVRSKYFHTSQSIICAPVHTNGAIIDSKYWAAIFHKLAVTYTAWRQ